MASSIGEPANISGVIVGNMASPSGCIPSWRYEPEITTSRRTASGWRIASCSPMPAPML